MAADPRGSREGVVEVPDIRDYHQINLRVVQLLDGGYHRIRLDGVQGQRLLLWRLRGAWDATIVVSGDAGPELAAELDAPGLRVVCTGNAGDGAGRALGSGELRIEGECRPAVGYAQRGGVILVRGSAAARAGLEQRGGWLVLDGPVGPLAGERQSGGALVLAGSPIGSTPGRGRRGGVVYAPEGCLDSALPLHPGLDSWMMDLRSGVATRGVGPTDA